MCFGEKHTRKLLALLVYGGDFPCHLDVIGREQAIVLAQALWYAPSLPLLHYVSLCRRSICKQLLAQCHHLFWRVAEVTVECRVRSENIQKFLLHGLQCSVLTVAGVLSVVVVFRSQLQALLT